MSFSLTSRLRTVVSCIITGILVIPLSACGNSSGNYDVSAIGPKIHIGIVEDAPGIGYIRSGQRLGLDVDVANYIVHELGYVPTEIVWHTVEPADRERVLNDGVVDVVVGGYSITQSRMKNVDFAGPYFTDGQALLVRKADQRIHHIEDLHGERVCIVRGSTSADYLREHAPDAVVEQSTRIDVCITSLLTGQVDAVNADAFLLSGANKMWGGNQLTVLASPFTTEQYGVAVRKGQPTLVKQINTAIHSMIADGSWELAVKNAASSIDYTVTPDKHRPR